MKTRREALKFIGGATLGGLLAGCAPTATPTPAPPPTPAVVEKIVEKPVEKGVVAKALLPAASKRVVILGGGISGAMCARTLRKLVPESEVVVVEKNPTWVSGPSHVDYLVGIEDLAKVTVGFDGLRRDGVKVLRATVAEVRPAENRVITSAGFVDYNILVVATGIVPVDEEIKGLAENTHLNYHAWEWERAVQFRKAIEEFKGGVFVVSVPPAPYKCPPGPYEVACVVQEYWKKKGVDAEIIIVDANDKPQPGPLAERWKEVLAARGITHKPSFKVVEFDPQNKQVISDKDEKQSFDLVSIIPPQKAALFVRESGLGDPFIEVDPATFQSKQHENIFAFGDGAKVPFTKSAFTAFLQGQFAAYSIARALGVDKGDPGTVFNQCWPYVSAEEALLVAAAWDKAGQPIADKTTTEGVSTDHVKQRKSWEYGILSSAYG